MAAMVIGSVGAFRDFCIQVYGWFRPGQWELAYAPMLGNGSGLNATDTNGSKDLTSRFQAGYTSAGYGAAARTYWCGSGISRVSALSAMSGTIANGRGPGSSTCRLRFTVPPTR